MHANIERHGKTNDVWPLSSRTIIERSSSQNSFTSFRSLSNDRIPEAVDVEIDSPKLVRPTPKHPDGSDSSNSSPLFQKHNEWGFDIELEEEFKELYHFVRDDGTDGAKAYFGPVNQSDAQLFIDREKNLRTKIIDVSVIDSVADEDILVYLEFTFSDTGTSQLRIAQRNFIFTAVRNFFSDYSFSENSRLGVAFTYIMENNNPVLLESSPESREWGLGEERTIPLNDLVPNEESSKSQKFRSKSEDLITTLSGTPTSQDSEGTRSSTISEDNRAASAPTIMVGRGVTFSDQISEIIPDKDPRASSVIGNERRFTHNLLEPIAAASSKKMLNIYPDSNGSLIYRSDSGSEASWESFDDVSSIDSDSTLWDSRPGTPTGEEFMTFNKSDTGDIAFSTQGNVSTASEQNFCKEHNLVFYRRYTDGFWQSNIDFLPRCVQIKTTENKSGSSMSQFVSLCTRAKSPKSSEESLEKAVTLKEQKDALKVELKQLNYTYNDPNTSSAVKNALEGPIQETEAKIQALNTKSKEQIEQQCVCKKWKRCHKYCLKLGCQCHKRHVQPISNLLRRTRTQLCTNDSCKGGDCPKAHSPEGVQKTFVTMCLDKILSIHSSTKPLDWKCFFPKIGQFNTTLDFFSYVHETVADWTITNRYLFENSQTSVIKRIGTDEQIWSRENFSKNITRWVNLAYNDGELDHKFRLWPNEDGSKDQYREDIIRLLGARIETEGHHLKVYGKKGEKKVAVHKSLGCKGELDKSGNYSRCPYFCNCFKGFHTLREFMKKVPKKSLLSCQADMNYIIPENTKKTDQVTLEIDGRGHSSAFLKQGHKYTLVCRTSVHHLVKLTKLVKENNMIPKYTCTFKIQPTSVRASNRESYFKPEDLEQCPEILAFDFLVTKPILRLPSSDFTRNRSRLTFSSDKVQVEDNTIGGLEKGGRYLLRFFKLEDGKNLFYDELYSEYCVKNCKRSQAPIHFLDIKEGFVSFEYSYLEVYRAPCKGSREEKVSYGTLIPIIEKNYIETSYVIGCSDESEKVEVIKERNSVYTEIMKGIVDYNETLERLHISDGFCLQTLSEKWKETIRDYMGNPLFNFKPLQIRSQVVSPVDEDKNYSLGDLTQFPAIPSKSENETSENKNTQDNNTKSISQVAKKGVRDLPNTCWGRINPLLPKKDSVEPEDEGCRTPPRNRSVDFGKNTASPDIPNTPPKKVDGKSPRRPKGILKDGVRVGRGKESTGKGGERIVGKNSGGRGSGRGGAGRGGAGRGGGTGKGRGGGGRVETGGKESKRK